MTDSVFYYENFRHNGKLNALRIPEIQNNLAYMLDFKDHKNLETIPHPNSIEISNDDITIFPLYVHFKENEYTYLSKRENVHFIDFCDVMLDMIDFEGIPIKVIDNLALLFNIISRSKNDFADILKNVIAM